MLYSPAHLGNQGKERQEAEKNRRESAEYTRKQRRKSSLMQVLFNEGGKAVSEGRGQFLASFAKRPCLTRPDCALL